MRYAPPPHFIHGGLHQRDRGTRVFREGTSVAEPSFMSRPYRTSYARIIAVAFAPALALGLAGCAGGYIDVDGYDAAYVEAAPVGIETYPRYAFRDGYVYDVNGRFYHQHNGRWVTYRTAPPEVARARAEHERGRALRQR